MSVKAVLARVLVVFVATLWFSEAAFALPIFARRYETSCTTCHTLIPKLNRF